MRPSSTVHEHSYHSVPIKEMNLGVNLIYRIKSGRVQHVDAYLEWLNSRKLIIDFTHVQPIGLVNKFNWLGQYQDNVRLWYLAASLGSTIDLQ